jgi:ribokinase
VFPSGVAPIFVESSGQNRIWVVKGRERSADTGGRGCGGGGIRGADFLVLQLEVPVETVYYAIRFARGLGVRTILNPAPGQRGSIWRGSRMRTT